MPATAILCERNGASPGKVTENVHSIQWKAVDDATTPFSNYNAVLGLGTNSYTKYNYIKFKGVFTTIGNVKVTHTSGALNTGGAQGISLKSSPSITQSTSRKLYVTPTRTSSSITPTDLSAVGASVNLLVGNAVSSVDGAGADGKGASADNLDIGAVYTNYFVTQLQVAANATTGDLDNVVLRITYDEL